jgi:hypothetical protein
MTYIIQQKYNISGKQAYTKRKPMKCLALSKIKPRGKEYFENEIYISESNLLTFSRLQTFCIVLFIDWLF